MRKSIFLLLVCAMLTVSVLSMTAGPAVGETADLDGQGDVMIREQGPTVPDTPVVPTAMEYPSGSKAIASWTLIFYIDGDNNLASYYQTDLTSIAAAGSSSQVNVLVLFDGATNTDSRAYYASASGLVNIPLSSIYASWTNEVNMGDPNTLVRFSQYCIANYPAQRYMVVPQDHGAAWVGCCWDDTSGGDCLTLAELRDAFSSLDTTLGRNVDLVFFNDCLMGNYEVCYQLYPYANYLVGCETLGWTSNFNEEIATVINALKAQPTMSAAALANLLVQEAGLVDSSDEGSQSISAVNLTRIPTLQSDLEDLSATLLASVSDEYVNIYSARLECSSVQGPYAGQWDRLIDLSELATWLAYYVDDSSASMTAQFVVDDLQSVIMSVRSTASVPFCHGLSIYFPLTEDKYDTNYLTGNSFTTDGHWNELLSAYYSYIIPLDAYEVDDTYDLATTLVQGEVQQHSIHNSSDVDWFEFEVISPSTVTIETFGPDGDTSMYIYNEAGAPSSYFTLDYDSGEGQWAKITHFLDPGLYYVKVVPGWWSVDIAAYYIELTVVPNVADWTVLVYLDADNDLEEYGIDDFLEMSAVGSDLDLSIVVLFDRSSDYSIAYGNWFYAREYYITPGMTPTTANCSYVWGELNMGDPQTLTDFLIRSMAIFPADNYAVVLWDHGGGVERRHLLRRLP